MGERRCPSFPLGRPDRRCDLNEGHDGAHFHEETNGVVGWPNSKDEQAVARLHARVNMGESDASHGGEDG